MPGVLSFFVTLLLSVVMMVQPVMGDQIQTDIERIRAKNFSQLESQWTALETSKEKNADGMYVFSKLVRNVAEELAKDPEGSLPLLNEWCQRNSYLAYLLRGRFYTFLAWNDRGSDFADKVLPESWHVFEERLGLAVKDFTQASSLNPNSAEPLIGAMVAYRGLDDRHNIEESFNRAVAIDDTHYGAYSTMLIAKMEKWGGSNQEMFNFAQSVYDQRHQGDPVFAFLLLTSHDELAARQKISGGIAKKSDYFRAPANAAAIRALLDEIQKVYPQSPKARNWAALVDYLSGQYAQALAEMNGLEADGVVDQDVWSKSFFDKTKQWLLRQQSQGRF